MASETPENSGSLADRITNPDAQPGTNFDKLPSFRVNNPSLLPAVDSPPTNGTVMLFK